MRGRLQVRSDIHAPQSERVTVDLVIVGITTAAATAAVEAAQRGQDVLIVGESNDARRRRGFRRVLNAAGANYRERVSVFAGFEVLSVDGISAIEVVLIRQVKTGRLVGINTSAVLVTTALASGVIAPMIQDQVQQTSDVELLFFRRAGVRV